MGMVELLHDRNFLANLVFCAAELVYELCVGRAGKIVPPELAHAVVLVLPSHTLDSLRAQ